MRLTGVRPLGWADPLEEGVAAHSSILENPMDRGAWRAQSLGPESQAQLKRLSLHTRALLSMPGENDTHWTVKPPGLLTEVSFCPSFHMACYHREQCPQVSLALGIVLRPSRRMGELAKFLGML